MLVAIIIIAVIVIGYQDRRQEKLQQARSAYWYDISNKSDEEIISEYKAYDYMINEAQCYSCKDMLWMMKYAEEMNKRWL